MSQPNCPMCSDVELGAPYEFAGRWLAACPRCHAEIKLEPASGSEGAGGFSLTATMKLPTLQDAERYRRRTGF